MNPVIDQKLAELAAEAESKGAAAVYAVLTLLRSSYNNGTHNQFAGHCAKFSPIYAEMDFDVKRDEAPDEFPDDLGEFHH